MEGPAGGVTRENSKPVEKRVSCLRDLDRRGVAWENFYDIAVVNIDCKPINPAKWSLAESGLLGPARLTPLQR